MSEPTCLTAAVYFWRPGGNASTRRRNEQRRMAEVNAWLAYLDLPETVTVSFSWSESCANVYRRLVVAINGRKSNLTALRSFDPADAAKRARAIGRATR